jgi:spore coat polysaccharide biosynthesis predicted glycosyltransferase SpsG
MGTGHVMRCWALAEEFSARGASISWLATLDVPWLKEALRQSRWSISTPQGTERDQALAVDADVVIVDSYSIKHIFRQTLLDRGIFVLAIVDDSTTDSGPASLWVNPGAPASLRTAPDTAFLNGPEFVLIRRAIRELREMREGKEIQGADIAGITFLLGGTDFAGFAADIDSISKQVPAEHSIFAGPGHPGQAPTGVSWLHGGAELLQRAATSTLVVSAAGVTSWELAHIGVPMALFQVAENQSGNYEWMTSQGWAWPLGKIEIGMKTHLLAEQICSALEALNKGRIIGSSRIDGLGAARIVDKALTLT